MNSSNKIRVFAGATAIITGGASGIGRAIAEALAIRGCEVVLVDLQEEVAVEVAAKICRSGGKAVAMQGDVTNFERMKTIVQETVRRTGRLDYLFNNAGIAIGGTVDLYEIEDWNHILNINLYGVINGIQAAYGIMKSQGFGHIVNTSSVAGLLPSAGLVSYATTKHALVGLSISLRAEAEMLGIQVSVLCPGFAKTDILNNGGKYGKNLMNLSPKQQKLIGDITKSYKPVEPSQFAESALKQIALNKAIIIFPYRYRFPWWLFRTFPDLSILLAKKHFNHIQKKLSNISKF